MILLVFMLMLIPRMVLADVFSKSKDQGVLDTSLAKDYQNNYYRGSYDYNANAQADSPPYRLERGNISLGCNRYDFHESLKNLFTRPEFNDAELEILMQQLSASKLLVWQYSSPTLADLYKHLDTTGHLRLGIRYQQCEDLEKSVDDPTTKLRKQAVMDCIRRKEGSSDMDDIDLAFKSCFDNLHSDGGIATPYGALENPGDGDFYLAGSVNITEKVLDRVNKNGEDLKVIKQIVPRVIITNNSVTVEGPLRKSRELIAQYRNDFLKTLSTIVSNYKSTQEVDKDNIPALSVFGVPLTEGQIKNIAMLDDTESLLAMNKIASGLAYLKTIDQYVQASQLLDRVMSHPAIEPGYKTLLRSGVDYVQKEIITLKEEKDRLSQYADTMRSILDEADKERMKAIALIKEESISQAQKGIFKLNP